MQKYDLVIIGAGPAGAAAGVYAARKKLRTLLLTKDFLGQSAVSDKIYNWIGEVEISGIELSKKFEQHLNYYRDQENSSLEIISGVIINSARKDGDDFVISDSKGTEYMAKNLLLCSGSSRKKLSVPGAEKYEHRGITYCASCDGPLFADMDVAVIGGGNAGFETASQLLAYAKSVTLLHHRENFKADKITIEKTLRNEKMTAIANAELAEVFGDNQVAGLRYFDNSLEKQKEIAVQGIFVEIGHIPNTDIVRGLVDLDGHGKVVVDAWTMQTSQNGVWASGDCSNVRYHQNNIAAGDAVKAVENIYHSGY